MRPVQEVTGARFLHDFGPRVAAHMTEAIVAEDDGAVLHPRVGYDKLSTCIKVKQRKRRREREWTESSECVSLLAELVNTTELFDST